MISEYQANHYLTSGVITTQVYVGLLNAQRKEVTATEYKRMPAFFAEAAGGMTVNNADVVFPAAVTDWGEIAHIALYSAEIEGVLLFVAPAQVTQRVYEGNTYKIPKNFMTVRFMDVVT